MDEHSNCSGNLYCIRRGKLLELVKLKCKGNPPEPRCECSMTYFDKLDVVDCEEESQEALFYWTKGTTFRDSNMSS